MQKSYTGKERLSLMTKARLLAIVWIGLMGAVRMTAAQTDAVVALHGYGAFEFGQVVKGDWRDTRDTSHIWMQRAVLQMSYDTRIKERSRVVLSLEAMMSFSFPQIRASMETTEPVTFIYFHQAEGTYTVGPMDRPWLEIGFGYFPFKYDPDVTNLGEYLFRSGTYPPYLITNFDFPQARLLGLHLHNTLTFDNPIITDMRQDLLLTSQSQTFPTQNFTLTYLPGMSLCGKMFDVGAGVSLCHLLSVFGDDYVSPKNNTSNKYLTNIQLDSAGAIIAADTNYYTFKGTKLMARCSIDPKRIWAPDGDFGIFGENDLRLYGETAILGLKNYPMSMNGQFDYDTLHQRWPAMIGWHVPTCKLMDVLSIEWEYFPSRIANSYRMVSEEMIPLPPQKRTDRDYAADDIKWSLYGMKRLNDVFSLRAIIGRDHMRILTNDKKLQDKEESLRAPDHWYWMLKAQYQF
jgi:hypothetical protein